jgi:AAA+ ATPase superfamily predicted ATPase
MIGREIEKQILNQKLMSPKSEFVALYGRRRVGKTYLVRSVYRDKIVFSLTGLGRATFQQQLDNFNLAVKKLSLKSKFDPATNWMEAFHQISKLQIEQNRKRKLFLLMSFPGLIHNIRVLFRLSNIFGIAGQQPGTIFYW